MHPNAKAIEDFYTCFGRRDAEGMARAYAPDVAFSDPVFPALRGDEARSMWRMLTSRATDLRIEASAIQADDRSGSAHWDAYYTFSQTGRHVHNRVDATFVFEGGLITKHEDRFDFAAWAGQALGLPGKLFGWTSLLQNKVRGNADAGLRAYMKKHG